MPGSGDRRRTAGNGARQSTNTRNRGSQATTATRGSREGALKIIAAAVPGLAEALGPNAEVLLHDLGRIPNSIVAVSGTLTGRSPGGPVTDLLLRHIRQGNTQNMLHYRTNHADGRTFRSSTVFLRDEDGVPFACLCVNVDVTKWEQARAVLDSYIAVAPVAASVDANEPADDTAESFLENVTDLAKSMIDRAIDSVAIPVELMQKPHKMAVVRDLDCRGLFLIKDAVEETARALRVTKFTVYNYLNQIRESDAPTSQPVK